MAIDPSTLASLRREFDDIASQHFTGVTQPTPAGRTAIERLTDRYGYPAVAALLAELDGPRYVLPADFR